MAWNDFHMVLSDLFRVATRITSNQPTIFGSKNAEACAFAWFTWRQALETDAVLQALRFHHGGLLVDDPLEELWAVHFKLP